MKDIYIENTLRTPAVHFSFQKKQLEISGISLPENPASFYDPLISWIEKYVGNPSDEKTKIVLKLFCYNSGTAASIVTMLKTLRRIEDHPPMASGRNLEIEWFYEEGDEDMQEEGQIMEAMINHPFVFRSCPRIPYRPQTPRTR